jgi:hypothetical protein
MNNMLLKLFSGCLLLTLAFTACKKDDITGDVQDVNIYKDKTTYEFLNSHPSFDTLVQMIDAAGLKDKINAQGASFFPPTDWTIYNYLSARTLIVQNTINQNSKWGLDSMLYYLSNNIKGTRDSLQMYLIAQPLTFDKLTEAGVKYPTGLANDTAVVSYKTVTSGLGYNSNFSSPIRVVYYSHPYILGNTPKTTDILCTTSGILTKNGVVHVLSSGHSLFFRQ